jgi:phage terminase small subunit
MLTPRQRRFVAEYTIDQDAVAAYERAGYKGKGRSARSAAGRLLQVVDIQAAIEAALAERKEKLLTATEAATQRLEVQSGQSPPAVREEAVRINAELLMRETGAVAFSDLGDVFDFSGERPKLRAARQIPPHARRAISSIKFKRYVDGRGEDARDVEVVEVKFWDKLSALEKLMKVFGLGREPAPLQDIIHHLAMLNPEYAAEVRRIITEKVMSRRKGVPAPEPIEG